jgi:hypothetical protein
MSAFVLDNGEFGASRLNVVPYYRDTAAGSRVCAALRLKPSNFGLIISSSVTGRGADMHTGDS